MRQALRVLALLATAAGAAVAVDWKVLRPEGYVSDFAHVIDAQSRAELERYCGRVEAQTGAQLALVTIRSLEGEPIEDVANTIYRAWGVGQKGKNEGALLLLVIGDRRSRLEVGYGLEPYLPDGFDGSILRSMRPALRQSHYGEAMLAAAETIGSRVAQAKGVALDTPAPRRIRQRPQASIPWPLVVGGIILLVLVLGGAGGGLLPALLLGNVLGAAGRRGGGGGGGGSGGGFGGSDSGDSFGGFGGGDSGGGGASSDW